MSKYSDLYLLDGVEWSKNTWLYLAGPYSPHKTCPTWINLGRLYTYNFLLSAQVSVMCYPLMTAGFDTTRLHAHLDYEDWMTSCYKLITDCDVFAYVPSPFPSSGTLKEIEYAKLHHIPIIELPRITANQRAHLINEFYALDLNNAQSTHGLGYLNRLAPTFY